MRRQILQRACHSSSSSLPPPPRILGWNSPGRPTRTQQLQTLQPLSSQNHFFSNLPRRTLRTPIIPEARLSFSKHHLPLRPQLAPIAVRPVSSSQAVSQSQHGSRKQSYNEEVKGKTLEPDEIEEEDAGFVRSEKAAQASQLNLSARLSKEGAHSGTSIDYFLGFLTCYRVNFRSLD